MVIAELLLKELLPDERLFKKSTQWLYNLSTHFKNAIQHTLHSSKFG